MKIGEYHQGYILGDSLVLAGEYIQSCDVFRPIVCEQKYLKDKKQDSLQQVPKDAHMFFLGHYLFLKTHSFPQALLSENCSHPGMFNIGRKILVDVFACNGGYCSFIINVIVDFPNRR